MFEFLKKISCCSNDTVKNNIINEKIDSSYLDNIDYNDTVQFIPPITYGKVIKVYDGDTITIATRLPNTTEPIYRFSVRFLGIDSPEIKGKTEKEKALAIVSRDNLEKLIMNKIVYLQNVSLEKYGRILADVYIGNIHVNNWLLKKGYAIKYDGGKKIIPNEWLDNK